MYIIIIISIFICNSIDLLQKNESLINMLDSANFLLQLLLLFLEHGFGTILGLFTRGRYMD